MIPYQDILYNITVGLESLQNIEWSKIDAIFLENSKRFFTAFVQVNGYDNLIETYFNATAENQALQIPGNSSSGYCGEVPADSMNLFRGQESDLPWTGVSTHYWWTFWIFFLHMIKIFLKFGVTNCIFFF